MIGIPELIGWIVVWIIIVAILGNLATRYEFKIGWSKTAPGEYDVVFIMRPRQRP